MKEKELIFHVDRTISPCYESPYTRLAAAIVELAVRDYIKDTRLLLSNQATIERKRKIVMERSELECFFFSPWFEMLTDLNPSALILRCQKKAVALETKRNRDRFAKVIAGKEQRK